PNKRWHLFVPEPSGASSLTPQIVAVVPTFSKRQKIPSQYESVNTAPPLRKRDKVLDFLSLPKSLSKVKAKRSTQSLKSQALSEQSPHSSAASQIDSQQATPLLMASNENRPLKDILPEYVTKPAVKNRYIKVQPELDK
ncbi:hypothetical protein K457DRAFT_13591, partial [Linnemannia elongata AG-77]